MITWSNLGYSVHVFRIQLHKCSVKHYLISPDVIIQIMTVLCAVFLVMAFKIKL